MLPPRRSEANPSISVFELKSPFPCESNRIAGELIGNGSLIIGPTAEVISNLRGLNEVRGMMACSDLLSAEGFGCIRCQSPGKGHVS